MADKIIINSDGTVKGTTVKINGIDMTKDYKVTNIYFSAHGGYIYNSSYSENNYTEPPNVNYDISYLDGDKRKSMGMSTPSYRYEYGTLAQKDSLYYIGIDNDKKVKERLLNDIDILREKTDSSIPKKILLQKRTIESLSDKYIDLVNEIELKAKKEKK